jgi:S1-C subfamily serine protease
MRVYLGTIPDYAPGEIEGVKLSGVKAGGPAEQAGVQGGDVIVDIAGKSIKNIYDYTYAMDALKIGEGVPIVVVRDGKRVTLTIVPAARQ